jgi:hypothetical protein
MDKLTTVLHLDTTMDHPVVKLGAVLQLLFLLKVAGTQHTTMYNPMFDSTHMLLHLILHLLSDLLLRIAMGGTPTITNGVALMTISKGRSGHWTVVLFSTH